MNKEELLELREKIKNKKPDFVRQEYKRRKTLAEKWRKPKGLQSKMRRKFKGRRKSPSTGYGSPKEIKGFDVSGLKQIYVNSINDLENVDAKEEGIILSTRIGLRKKIEIIKKATEKKIKILNIKNTEEFLKKVEEQRKKDKEKREEKTKEKEKKKKEKEKKVAEKKKEKLSEKLTEEEKKEKEKKEQDKLLTQKEA